MCLMVKFSDLSYPISLARAYLIESGFCDQLVTHYKSGQLNDGDMDSIENSFRQQLYYPSINIMKLNSVIADYVS
jgi:hypothetical protein